MNPCFLQGFARVFSWEGFQLGKAGPNLNNIECVFLKKAGK